MAVELDRDTIERLRLLDPGRALQVAKDAVYGTGAVGSEDFLDLYEQLVREGVLTWNELNEADGIPRSD